jgi:two-component system sensor histidine kinase CpxA
MLADGRLQERVPPLLAARRDELGDLGRDFDAMADRLQTMVASRQRLLRDVSHELRSPLARIRVALELARRKGSEGQAELERIEHETERLDALLGHVLQLARLDDPAAPTRFECVDLTALLDGIAEDARLEAQAAGCRLVRAAADPLRVRADPTLLRSGLENVVRNALRYTAAGTAVEVTQAVVDGWVRISIRDHGPGVPPQALERIFEPFFRVADARERDSGGEGIGLAITAHVARVHGGRVQASNAPGGGLQVDFDLPRASGGSA